MSGFGGRGFQTKKSKDKKPSYSGGNGNGTKISKVDKTQCCKLCNTIVGAGDYHRVQIGENIFHLRCLQEKLTILNIQLKLEDLSNGNGIISGKVCVFLNDNLETIVRELGKKKCTMEQLQAAESISNIMLYCMIKKNDEFKPLKKEISRIGDLKQLFTSALYAKQGMSEKEKLVKRFLYFMNKIEELEELEVA